MTELNSFEQRLRDFLSSHPHETNTYQALARAMDPDVNPRDRRFKRLTTALLHVNTYEDEHQRPMLGALVVRASDGLPGDGFYWCARELKHEFEDDEAFAFWQKELARVGEYWGDQPEETQLDRIEAKLDRILTKLAG
jgi:Fe-S-cluster formation regulator IscX/YfhJ